MLIDHNNEETLPLVLATGLLGGPLDLSEHQDGRAAHGRRWSSSTAPSASSINSAADWGVSDPLKVPKTAAAMREAGIAEAAIEHDRAGSNPVAFFAQSGRLDLEELGERPTVDQRELFEGNSVLRGQTPRGSSRR